jgi:hypothetical protein
VDFIEQRIARLEEMGAIQPVQEGSATWWEMHDREARFAALNGGTVPQAGQAGEREAEAG